MTQPMSDPSARAPATEPSAAPGVPDADMLDSADAGGKAIRGGGARTIGFGVSLLLGLAYVPFMTRHLGAADYGRYLTVSAIVFIVGGLTEAGLTNLGIREYSTLRGAERDRLLRNLIGLRLALTAAGVVVAVGLAAVTGSEHVVVVGTAIAGLALFVSLAQQTYMIPLTANLRFGWVTTLEVLKQATLTGFILVCVVFQSGLMAFFWASVGASLAMTVATLLVLRADTPLVPSFDLAAWRAILRETLAYALAAAVGLIYFRIAVVLLSYLGTPDETGYFSAAFRIVEVVGAIPNVLVSSAFPILARAARDDQDRLGYALQRMFEVALLLGAGIAVALAVGAPVAIDIIAGDGFQPSVDVLRIQAAALVTTFLVVTWLFALLSLRLHKQLLVANSIAAVVAIVGTVVLAPSLGAQGAAIATVAAEAALAIASLTALRRSNPALTPTLAIVPKVAAAAAPAVVLALVLDVHPAVEAAAALAVYGAGVVALRAVPPEIVAAVRRRA